MKDYYQILGTDRKDSKLLHNLSFAIKIREFKKGSFSEQTIIEIVESYVFLKNKKLKKRYDSFYKELHDISFLQDKELMQKGKEIYFDVENNLDKYVDSSPNITFEITKFIIKALTINLFLLPSIRSLLFNSIL